ncbi:hypothetical protein INN71_15820 [Nocardioides sp. ChNu-153]|uniref:hypothetical protein n=1 Tax=unclassified Nocardioides TaxID=2615069 RepID=UPI0024055ABC|nr:MULTISPECIES: hypothetical protein [unclassified Nocardioides]MDF9716349.1 hypothetical protein [Nocardioides sp. ChNu-99]MDN7122855.1 hypothetical protein [Nocardioides sp. ChNu-153]
MTAHPEPRPARRTSRGTVRRVAVLAAAPALAVLAAGPAHADVPLGWDPAQESVDPLHVLWLLVGIPLGLILLIAAAVYLPAIARGKDVRPGAAHAVEAEWFGGPRRAPEELAAPDTEESQAGGASGRW